ncbi:MAG: HemK/PrmC family methyltransferase [Candidatus Hydrothermia bacterium]
MKVRQAYNYLKERLREVSREPEAEARWVLEELTGSKFEVLFVNPSMEFAIEAQIEDILEQRVKLRKPLQYIFKKAFFMGLEFYVDERVLIPRQDTEVIVEYALNLLKKHESPRWVDVCTGSGAIAVALEKYYGGISFASDLYPEAIEVAKLNAVKHNSKINFIACDLLQGFCSSSMDLIISNPPYIGAWEYEALSPEVRTEPPHALLGGEVGYEITIKLLEDAYRVLKPTGDLIIETSLRCYEEIKKEKLFNFFLVKRKIYDLTGNFRGLHLVKAV